MLTYALEKNGSSSLYTQLYGCIRRDILSGALPPRQKLPSKRALAQHLEVSVITVKNAYEQLAAEGYLTGADPDSDGMPCWEDGCLFTIAEQNGQDSIHVEQDSKNITGADPLPRTEEESGAACQLPPAEAEQGQSDFCQPVKTEGGEPDALQNTVTFDAQKWRSALGAYFFTDCTASRDAQGHWGDYTVGAAAIS